MVEVFVRPAVDDDLRRLREIERASGQRYREFGLDRVADDEPASIEVLRGYAKDGRAWVAVNTANELIGYIVVDEIDGGGHVEQVSVAPDYQGRGAGRTLIDQAARWATARGFKTLTLTTFGHIPWNRPLYAHLGFRVLSTDEIGVGLKAVREAETEHGLDPDLRVVMCLDLDG
jgi:ribosomal protein S18 acetylase RimI-like enzyme